MLAVGGVKDDPMRPKVLWNRKFQIRRESRQAIWRVAVKLEGVEIQGADTAGNLQWSWHGNLSKSTIARSLPNHGEVGEGQGDQFIAVLNTIAICLSSWRPRDRVYSWVCK